MLLYLLRVRVSRGCGDAVGWELGDLILVLTMPFIHCVILGNHLISLSLSSLFLNRGGLIR